MQNMSNEQEQLGSIIFFKAIWRFDIQPVGWYRNENVKDNHVPEEACSRN